MAGPANWLTEAKRLADQKIAANGTEGGRRAPPTEELAAEMAKMKQSAENWNTWTAGQIGDLQRNVYQLGMGNEKLIEGLQHQVKQMATALNAALQVAEEAKSIATAALEKRNKKKKRKEEKMEKENGEEANPAVNDKKLKAGEHEDDQEAPDKSSEDSPFESPRVFARPVTMEETKVEDPKVKEEKTSDPPSPTSPAEAKEASAEAAAAEATPYFLFILFCSPLPFKVLK